MGREPIFPPSPGPSWEDRAIAAIRGIRALLVVFTVGLLLSPWQAPPAAAQGSLLPGPRYLDTAGGPTDLVVEDLDGDEVPDLLLAGERSGVLVIHRGLGGGDFSTPQPFNVAGRPSRVAAGDLDRDGLTDLLWIDGAAGTFHWIYATGDPENPYTGARTYLEGEETSGLLLVDLNEDEWPDAVVSVGGGDQIAIHLNDGEGSLLSGEFVRVGDRPGPLLEVTHPQTGAPRLVLAQQGALSANVAVYDGLPPILDQELSTGGPMSLARILWDDDASPDLLVIGGNGSRLQIHGAQGDGSFQPLIDVACEPGSVTATELDRIGALRRVVVGELERSRLTLFEGLPGETMSPRQSWFVGKAFGEVISADLDGLGRSELLVPLPEDDRIALIQQEGAGLRAFPSVAVGVLPLEVRYQPAGAEHPARVAVLHSVQPTLRIYEPADGSLRLVQTASPAGKLHHLNWGYVDDDGHPDLLLVREGEGVVILIADGNGGFLPPSSLATGGLPQDLAHGDVDGDGLTDLAVADAEASATRIFYGDGAGGFEEGDPVRNAVPPKVVRLADLDQDQYADLLMLDGTNFLYMYFNDEGRFGIPVRPVAGSDPRAIHLTHITPDPYPDIVVIAASAGGAYSSYLSVAPRAYSLAAYADPLETGYSSSSMADVSGDGMPDLVLTPTSAEGVALRQGVGDGYFSTQFPVTAANLVLSVDTGDLDGDGLADVILLDGLSRCMHLLMQDPDPLVPVAGTLRASRSQEGVLLSVQGSSPLQVERERDGRIFVPSRRAEMSWEAFDSSPARGGESYRLLDGEGRELDRASVGSLPVGTLVSFAPPSPNPGRGTVQIRFQAPRGASLILRVVDARGRVVRRLAVQDGGAGWYRSSWQGRDESGAAVARGRYHLDLQVDGRRFSRALVWMGS